MSPQPADFPGHLADAPPGPRARETFGLGPSLVAVALGGGGAHFALTPGASIGLAELGALALLFGGAAACIGYEVRRRRQRAVLVLGPKDVGIYREGRLLGMMSWRALEANRAFEPTSIKLLFGLATLGLGFILYGVGEEASALTRLTTAAPGVWVLLLTASFARGAYLCETYHLPGSRTRALVAHTEIAAARLEAGKAQAG
jgi:hypothetical protein